MTAAALARASFTRFRRDRVALFFFIALPVLVILLVGATVRGFDEFRVGVIDEGAGPVGAALADDFVASPVISPQTFDDQDAARTALRRGEVDTVVVLPAGMDADLRAGEPVSVPVFAERANTAQQAALAAVSSIVADRAGAVEAAVFVTERVGGSFDANLELVGEVAARTPPVDVTVRIVDGESSFLPEGFSYSAPTMLVLFVFINSFAAGAAMIQSRDLGIYERMLAGPVRPRSIVAGETAVYFGLALLQSVLVVAVGAVVFGVHWGDPAGATALVFLWALVGTGAGLLSGTVFRTPEQAQSIGPPIGIAFGMLGGTMWPLEIVPPVMATIGHATPHAWAVDGWIVLLARDGGIRDLTVELAVLGGFAAALLALATTRLQHRLTA